MSEPTIPPPSEADLKTDRFKAYRCCSLLPDPGGEVVACLIRLLHAAESQREELRKQVAKLREALAGLRAQVNYDLYDQLTFAEWNAAIRAADDALATAPKEPAK